MDCIVYMVAIEEPTGDEVYVAIEFSTDGERYPENNPDDIKRVVDICNANGEPDLIYIDMYGIQKAGQDVDKWEEIEDAV